MELTAFKVLTFDCYGTLIDWETGIANALAGLVNKAGRRHLSYNEILENYARHEADQEVQTPTMPYSRLLAVVYRRLAKEWDVTVADDEANAFGASVPDWPAFPDSTAALQYLKRHYKLVILSNVDRESFRGSNARLGVAFDAIYTAEDIGSYKPNRRNFEYMLKHLRDDLGLTAKDVLHTAQSLFHDHVPAKTFELASAWIDRRHADEGWGATMPPAGKPSYDFRFESLEAMVAAHRTVKGRS